MDINNQHTKAASELVRLQDCHTDIRLSYNKYRPWVNELFKPFVSEKELVLDAAEILNSYYQFQAFYLSLHSQQLETITVWNNFEPWKQSLIRRNLPCPGFFILDYAENTGHLEVILKAAADLAVQPKYKIEIIDDMRDKVNPGNRRDMLSEYFLISNDGRDVDAIYALNHAEAKCILAKRYGISYPLSTQDFIDRGFQSFSVVVDDESLSQIFPFQ